ncbi:multiple sugar transport system substrate-binding protein [Aurantimicrobium minutum]|uniref:ABC transporter substrate-binding protein n=1 Tax=Aurantimicrobium minutum TaxID=708131 RepID=UPI0024732FFF|nr:extracellular solute-binding protein [Aurantimicrobium minutum]MDH6532583.1 multiple sugar transport system substrate-binding protein [Aurantimicrobium minutum]
MKLITRLLSALLAATTVVALAGCAPAAPADATVTVRLWDQNVADAYDTSFDELYKETGIRAETVVIPWADYWTQLRTDLATGTNDDIFWTNAGNFAEYAANGMLLPINKADFTEEWSDWDPAVVEQYTTEGTLWGVPQLSDPGIGLLYNKDLLAQYGVTEEQIQDLSWDPAASTDSLRQVTQQLTRDATGLSAADAGFDPQRVETFGFNAAFDLNAIVLNFLGSNGAAWQDGEEFVFDSTEGRQTFQYLTDLINVSHVSPPATDTNPPAGGDLSRDLFIQGKMALFETGSYNLANVQEGATFDWGIARIPAGPTGAVSVTNGIIAAGSTTATNSEAQKKVLAWLGGKGASYIGESGAALTAVMSERGTFFDYWSAQNIDVTPMIDVLKNGYIQAPRGAKYGEAQAAYLPYFTDIFTGTLSVTDGVPAAQVAANAAMAE